MYASLMQCIACGCFIIFYEFLYELPIAAVSSYFHHFVIGHLMSLFHFIFTFLSSMGNVMNVCVGKSADRYS